MSVARGTSSRLLLVCLACALLSSPAAAQTAIAELRASPARWINREVTVVGQVIASAPNPAGTTRGFYTLMDDTDPVGVIVRSRDLPPVGREYVVTGTWILDAGTGTALIDETGRQDAGGLRAPVAAGGGGGGGGGAARSGPGLVLILALTAIVGAVIGAGVLLLRGRSAPRSAPYAPGAPPSPPVAPAAGPLVDVSLEVRTPDGSRRHHHLRSAPILIGRSSGCTVTVDDPEVSRRHAEILVQNGRLVVVDLGSTHGTRVDGRRTDRAEIRAGSEIQIGGTRLRVL